MTRNPRSTAAIAGHPIHPIVVTFPIAFFVGAFVCDLVFWRSSNPMWATASLWLIGFGLIMAAVAAVLGATDFLGDHRVRAINDAWWHAGANVIVVLIELYNWYTRYAHGADAVVPTGLVLSLIAVLLLLFSGWKGGELVFRHRVGVIDDPERAQSTAPRSAPGPQSGRHAA